MLTLSLKKAERKKAERVPFTMQREVAKERVSKRVKTIKKSESKKEKMRKICKKSNSSRCVVEHKESVLQEKGESLRNRVEDVNIYLMRVRASLLQKRFYPPDALKKGVEGKILLSFRINEEGGVEDIKVRGNRDLCEGAKRMLEDVAPFPPPPFPLKVRIPIQFCIR